MVDRKISEFNVSTSLTTSDLFTFVVNGTNKNIAFSDLQTSLGALGTLSQVGDPLGAPVLEVESPSVYNVRNLEAGAGILPSVSAQNGISLKWNVAQDNTGTELVSNLSSLTPDISSLVEGQGISITKTGNAITNQISLAPNKNNLAIESKLIDECLENICENFGLDFTFPKSFLSLNKLKIQTANNITNIAKIELKKPKLASKNPPRKKPTPFNVFLDPVRIATHLNSLPF